MTRVVQLQDISPTSFVAGKHLAGKITSIKPYNDGTKLATLILTSLSSSPSMPEAVNALPTVEVELKGKWAKEALGSFSLGLVVIVSSEYAKVVKRKQQAGEKRANSGYRIQFENGIKGFTAAREEDRTPFSHANPDAIVEPTVAAPRNLPKSSSTTLHTPLRGDHGAIGGSELLQEVTNQLSNTNRTAGGPKRARTKSMDTLSVVERPEKKQMIEKVKLEEVEEMGILVKAERAVEEVAALDKLEKVMKETKPPGWPAALSTVALSSSGVRIGYYDCKSVHLSNKKSTFDLIGVVSAITEPRECAASKFKNWVVTLNLMDPSAPPGFDMLFGLFRSPVQKEEFPNAQPGDVIILRRLKYSEHETKGPTVTGYENKFLSHVFSSASLLDLHLDIPRSAGLHPYLAGYNGADLDYARYLAKWWKEGGRGGDLSGGVVKSGGGKMRKTVAVSGMEKEVFCNLVVEILGYSEVQDKPIVEVWCTDYSTHDQLFPFTSEHKRAECGVFGRRILMVAFWNGAAGDLSEIKKGTIRVLDNVRTRVSAAGILQGIISHGGVSKAWRPTISTFDASHRELVDGLLARRAAYWSSLDPAEGVAESDSDNASARISAGDEPSSSEIDLGVRCDHLADPISTIAQVLADTSDDAVHHIKARIVGYAAVESWIRAICPECYEPIPSGLSRCLLHAKSILVYCIDFQVVDDGEGSSPSSASLKIIIDDEDSAIVIPDLEPTESMRRGEGHQFAELTARFEKVLSRVGRDDAYFDMAVARSSTGDGEECFRLVGTRFVGVGAEM